MRIIGGQIRVADLPMQDSVVSDLEAEDVTFLGPAVILLLNGTSMDGCVFGAAGGGPEAVTWEIPADRNVIIGAVGISASNLRNCRFDGVGFAGPPDVLTQFFSAVTV